MCCFFPIPKVQGYFPWQELDFIQRRSFLTESLHFDRLSSRRVNICQHREETEAPGNQIYSSEFGGQMTCGRSFAIDIGSAASYNVTQKEVCEFLYISVTRL